MKSVIGSRFATFVLVFMFIGSGWSNALAVTYPIVDTGQEDCSNDNNTIICPSPGADFYGQDAQHQGYRFSFQINGDGTVSDLVTGLMWQQTTDSDGDGDIDADDKFTHTEAQSYCENLSLAGYTDWRLPHIKALYSLIDFRGVDCSAYNGTDTSVLTPYIDTTVFDYDWGDLNAGERLIDSQYASDTLYVDTSANPSGLLFGVNFADGRIKGYGLSTMNMEKTFFCMCVRGDTGYGVNDFTDNSDETVTDNATGLMWAKNDNGSGLNWEEALSWVQTKNAENYLGHDDWRLPNIKELQSLVDYTRSPGTTGSAAIDPLFNATAITNEVGETDYPYYWSSTTHVAYPNSYGIANYISFGRALGYMNNQWEDVHGAGAQKSEYKSGDPDDYPTGHGPQGDAVRIYNYVRLVRDADTTTPAETGTLAVGISPRGAADAGAQWSADGGASWNDGGTSAALDAGTYTVSFSAAAGYDSPASQSATVTGGQTVTLTGTYTEQTTTVETGSLTVTINPSGAVTDGAQWMLDSSGTWQNSGATLTDVEAGSHTISFMGIDGWTAPANQTADITAGGTAAMEGVYTEITSTGPSCDDGVQNGNETGVDCGGDCDPCSTGDDDGGDSGGGGCFVRTAVQGL